MPTRTSLHISGFYATYINALQEEDLYEALTNNTRRFRKLLKQIPKKKYDYAYAEGKWTIREMLQHIIDAERVFVYRAVTFARQDANALPGFDENQWANHAKASTRSWSDLVQEFKSLRTSTELFFASLDDQQLNHTGVANNNSIAVATLGFLCAGHCAHHMRILKERYLGKK